MRQGDVSNIDRVFHIWDTKRSGDLQHSPPQLSCKQHWKYLTSLHVLCEHKAIAKMHQPDTKTVSKFIDLQNQTPEVRMTIRLDTELDAALETYASHKRLSKNAVIRILLQEEMSKQGLIKRLESAHHKAEGAGTAGKQPS